MRALLRKLSFRIFNACDAVGFHLLPKHYYTPVPDHRWLRSRMDLWAHPASLCGVDWDVDDQLRWLSQTCASYYQEVAGLDVFRRLQGQGVGPGYGAIESQVLHCFVRSARPRRIVEIGSGVSTACMLNAIQRNRADDGPDTSIIAIEPYPKKAFATVHGIRHIEKLCQEVPLSVFDELAAGDLLFIDSSHVVKTGSEVQRIYLEILPRLKPGVFITIHDICLPYLYHSNVLSEYFDPQETSLLLALLVGNRGLSVCCCLSALTYDRPDQLRGVLSDYRQQARRDGLKVSRAEDGHFPSSTWLRVNELP